MLSNIFSVRACESSEFLCQENKPVFNLTSGNFPSSAEQNLVLGVARPATLREILSYQQRKAPYGFTDLNRK